MFRLPDLAVGQVTYRKDNLMLTTLIAMEPMLLKERLTQTLDRALLRLDAWWLVLLAVLLVFGALLLASMAAWCFFANGGRRFSGNWAWGVHGISIWLECV